MILKFTPSKGFETVRKQKNTLSLENVNMLLCYMEKGTLHKELRSLNLKYRDYILDYPNGPKLITWALKNKQKNTFSGCEQIICGRKRCEKDSKDEKILCAIIGI